MGIRGRATENPQHIREPLPGVIYGAVGGYICLGVVSGGCMGRGGLEPRQCFCMSSSDGLHHMGMSLQLKCHYL